MTLPVSIVIPAKNEEEFLPRLLTSIKDQSQQPAEIIVADGNSTDKTREIAESFGCKITYGGIHPGIARNNGAKLATQDTLIFFDSDVKLPRDFLKKTVKEFQDRKLGAASCFTIPDSKNILDHAGAFVLDLYFRLMQRFIQNAYGFCLFSKKSVFEKIGGFDESILIAEDWDFATRANKISTYRFLTSEKIIVSVRRFNKEGRLKMVGKYIVIFTYTTFVGKIKRQIVKYKFDQYSDKS